MKKIKCLLTDLDVVIRFFPRERALSLEEKFGLLSGAIYLAAFEKHV